MTDCSQTAYRLRRRTAAVGLFVLFGCGGPDLVASRDGVSSPQVPDRSVEEASSPEPTSSTSPSASTTEPLVVCRNSYDPECGPFRWDPEPAPNQSLSVEIVSYRPEHPKVGDTVEFTVRLRDPDAGYAALWAGHFGDERFRYPRPLAPCVGGPPTGAWTPPTPAASDVLVTHAFRAYEAGTFEVSFYAESMNDRSWRRPLSCGPVDPFASNETSETIMVVVATDPSASPWPTGAATIPPVSP